MREGGVTGVMHCSWLHTGHALLSLLCDRMGGGYLLPEGGGASKEETQFSKSTQSGCDMAVEQGMGQVGKGASNMVLWYVRMVGHTRFIRQIGFSSFTHLCRFLLVPLPCPVSTPAPRKDSLCCQYYFSCFWCRVCAFHRSPR